MERAKPVTAKTQWYCPPRRPSNRSPAPSFAYRHCPPWTPSAPSLGTASFCLVLPRNRIISPRPPKPPLSPRLPESLPQRLSLCRNLGPLGAGNKQSGRAPRHPGRLGLDRREVHRPGQQEPRQPRPEVSQPRPARRQPKDAVQLQERQRHRLRNGGGGVGRR